MFFLFKQKTAYEMRISDWSSDVCSSDQTWSGQSASLLFRVQRCDERLIAVFGSSAAFTGNQRVPQNLQLAFGSLKQTQPGSDNFAGRAVPAAVYLACDELIEMITQADARVPGHGASFVCTKFWRSEEHTSELQSLMRISYAVFC